MELTLGLQLLVSSLDLTGLGFLLPAQGLGPGSLGLLLQALGLDLRSLGHPGSFTPQLCVTQGS